MIKLTNAANLTRNLVLNLFLTIIFEAGIDWLLETLENSESTGIYLDFYKVCWNKNMVIIKSLRKMKIDMKNIHVNDL